jgi:hypothetical protein
MPRPKTTNSAPKSYQDERRTGFRGIFSRKKHTELASTPPSAPQAPRPVADTRAPKETEKTENIAVALMLDSKTSQPSTDKQPTESPSPQADSLPQRKQRQRMDAENEFQTAATKLEELMRQLIKKEHPKMVIEAIDFKDTADYHGSVIELGTVVDGLIDKWAESDENKNQFKKFAKKWYTVAFPYIKDGVTQVKVSRLHFSRLH